MKNKIKPLKIVVHIEEGIVRSVYADVPVANVRIYDTDPEFSDLARERRRLKKAIRKLTEVY